LQKLVCLHFVTYLNPKKLNSTYELASHEGQRKSALIAAIRGINQIPWCFASRLQFDTTNEYWFINWSSRYTLIQRLQ